MIEFEDPAGVAGTGIPSGGTSPANGVLLYDDNSQDHFASSSLDTCALPPADHALCTAILNDFISEVWQMS